MGLPARVWRALLAKPLKRKLPLPTPPSVGEGKGAGDGFLIMSMNKNEVWYFAYGCNVNTGQITSRVGECSVSRRAILKGYKRVFNVRSTQWGGLTANVIKTGDKEDEVPGVLYRITGEKLDVLTRYEGKPPVDVTVETEDGTPVQAQCYVFNPSRTPGKPPESYLNLILAGLKQHGYGEEVAEEVRRSAERATG